MINLEKKFPVVTTSIGNRYYDLIVKQAIRRYFADNKTYEITCHIGMGDYLLLNNWNNIAKKGTYVTQVADYDNMRVIYNLDKENLTSLIEFFKEKYFDNYEDYYYFLSSILETIGVELI